MALVIDSHIHCGKSSGPTFENYLEHIGKSTIQAAVMFASVAEIYDRYHHNFQDNQQWQRRRKEANEHILSLSNKLTDFKIYPFLFVWNDFVVDQTASYLGIKWHRHDNEPEYQYDSPKCKVFIDEIQRRNLPVILEEEHDNTLFFINELAPKATVIIPHCGLLNGGYEELLRTGIWERENIYADTALADPEIIEDFIKRYGYEKIMFGSDFPFGDPKDELENILRLEVDEDIKRAITSLNILRLLEQVKG